MDIIKQCMLHRYCSCFKIKGLHSLHTYTLAHSVHDRKISVLGFCSLLQAAVKPSAFVTTAPKIIPAVIKQMEGLIEAYKRKCFPLVYCARVCVCVSVCVCVCVRACMNTAFMKFIHSPVQR